MVFKKMNKVVVIGGSGFIGSHVADCLSESGYQVTHVDLGQGLLQIIGEIDSQ